MVATTLEEGNASSPFAERAQIAVVDYTLWLDGFDRKFVDGSTNFKFAVGVGQVIRGWDVTIGQMHVGERRRVVIPASLGYGARDVGPIPGGASLYFDIQLRALEPTKSQLAAMAKAEVVVAVPEDADAETLTVSHMDKAQEWKCSYRLELPSDAGDAVVVEEERPVLQVLAELHNTSKEQWACGRRSLR